MEEESWKGVENAAYVEETSPSADDCERNRNQRSNNHAEASRPGDIQFENKEMKGNIIGVKVEAFWKKIYAIVKDEWKLFIRTVIVLSAVLYNAFFIYAIYYGAAYLEKDLDYCDDVGFLIILTVTVYIFLFYFYVVKPYFPRQAVKKFKQIMHGVKEKIPERAYNIISYSVGPLFMVLFVLIDTRNEPERLYSALGLLILIFLGFIFSKHPGYIVWRHVQWGMLLQFVFGLLILRWEVGKNIFQCLGKKVSTFLSYTDSGSTFVFGYLVDQQPFFSFLLNNTAAEVAEQINENLAVKFIFMFKVLSIIYFFNFFVSMLFYLGAMQWIVVKIGWILQESVGTTACESLNAAANIFLGQSEAPLMIKPYLPFMTKSEIHAVMTGGFATVAGTVLAAYISFGVSASHLLTASVMSAPAALAYAKLWYPETKKSKTTTDNIIFPESEDSNLLDAASNGAMQAVFLVGNIAASLIAILAFVSFVNGLLGWFGGLVGAPFISLEYIFSLVFYPLSFLMGVDCRPAAPCCDLGTCPEDFFCDQCQAAAVLVGTKTIVNEFVAFQKLPGMVSAGMLTKRSEAIVTFALCGFSNIASIGIQIASLAHMAPARRGDISKVAVRAFIAGSCACFLTACIAGVLIPEDQL